MSLGSRILTLVIAAAFVAVGVAVLIQRIGAVIGWDNAARDWWVFVLIILLILLITFIVYRTVSARISR
jgi:putative flippase GtrA